MTPYQKFVQIGKVTKSFGYKGEVKVVFDKTLKKGFPDVEAFFFSEKDGHLPFFVENYKRQADPNRGIIKFESLNTREEAGRLKGKNIYVEDSLVADPEAGIPDITGYRIIDQDKGPLGRIQDIMSLPQQEIAVFYLGDREILLPLNGETVTGINENDRTITVRLPEGLLDIYQ